MKSLYKIILVPSDRIGHGSCNQRALRISFFSLKTKHNLKKRSSSRSFMVSGLTFRSLINFEFIFVYGVRKCSIFILLQVVDQFSQSLMGCSAWGDTVRSDGSSSSKSSRQKKCRLHSWVGDIPWRRKWQHSPVAWRIPWTEEPSRLQPMGSQRGIYN